MILCSKLLYCCSAANNTSWEPKRYFEHPFGRNKQSRINESKTLLGWEFWTKLGIFSRFIHYKKYFVQNLFVIFQLQVTHNENLNCVKNNLEIFGRKSNPYKKKKVKASFYLFVSVILQRRGQGISIHCLFCKTYVAKRLI